jgi:hypothetical protein
MADTLKLDPERLKLAIEAYWSVAFRDSDDRLRAAISAYLSSGPERAAVEADEHKAAQEWIVNTCLPWGKMTDGEREVFEQGIIRGWMARAARQPEGKT